MNTVFIKPLLPILLSCIAAAFAAWWFYDNSYIHRTVDRKALDSLSRSFVTVPSPTDKLSSCQSPPMSSFQNSSLGRLLSDNEQWAEEFKRADPGLLQRLAVKQVPHVLWIGCSDSRVPESVVTAARPGDIFVHRNIANQVHLDDDSGLSVLAYAVGSLGVEHVLVVGHSECGGAAACLNAVQNPSFTANGSITTIPSLSPDAPLNRWLGPLTQQVRSLHLSAMPKEEALPVVVRENVKWQVENICKTQTITDAWANNDPNKRKVWVHGWVYDLASGKLEDLHVSRGPTESN